MPDTPTIAASTKPGIPAHPPDASKGMALFVMIVATLYFGKQVLMPVTLALLLAFILAPLVDLLRRIYLGRVPSVLLGVLLAIGIISGVGTVIGSQIGELSNDLPNYMSTIDSKISTLKHDTLGQLSKMGKNFGQHKDGASLALAIPALQPPNAAQPAAAAPAPTPSPIEIIQRFISPLLSPLGNLGIVFVVAVFALLQREDLRDRLIRLIGSEDLHRTTLAIDEAGRRLSKYFVTQLTINTLFGVMITIGLHIIGVPNPVLWGILSGLLRFIPYVGSYLSAVLPLALAAAVEPGWSMMLSTAIFYALIEAVTGQVVEPLVYGHSTGISPFSVVVAAIFWSWLWGPIGLILSTPLTLCLVVIGRHVKRLEFLDIMLGDRSPLSPMESFYQRILAGDADELQDQAEKLLKDRSLSTYYDEVAVKGLQLAAHDALREALDAAQFDRIIRTVKLLIHGLDRFIDRQPQVATKPEDGPAGPSDRMRDVPRNPDPRSVDLPRDQLPTVWQGAAPILSIAGRGPLDELAAEMLAQLLSKHGLGGRLIEYDEVSREQIHGLNTNGVAMVCVSYLDIRGNPAHLRYLMQRLRQHLPEGTPVLVGMWPVDDDILNDQELRDSIGADYYVTSLEQAVTMCTTAARKAASV